ncbi:MAG: hypothetical protein AAB649_07710 [Patescibacteria group bacterium]
MTRAAKYSSELCELATNILSTGKSLASICSKLNITRTTLYEWRDTHPEFRDAIELGLQKAQEVWEQMGRDGINGDIKGFGAAPWIFSMKNRFRADYAEEKEHKSTNDSIVEQLLLGKKLDSNG